MYDSGHRAGDGDGGEGGASGGSISRAAVAIACSGAFLAFLDATIVNIAFPDIEASFPGADRGALSWVLDGYFVVIAALLVPAGGLADRYGHRRIFTLGVVVFTAASLLCALAPSLGMLVAFRVLQGVGAAIVFAARRALAGREDPVAHGRRARLPDLPGALILALGLALLTLAIVEGNAWGWGSASTLGAFAAAAVSLAVVARRSVTHPRPIVEPELFAHRSFRIGNLGTLLFSAAFFSIVLGNVLFLTSVWGYSVLGAGLATLPGPLASTIVAGPAGRLADRVGQRAVIVPGALLFAAGVMVLRSAGAEPDWAGTWLPGALLTGTGIGLAFPVLGSAAVRDIADDRFATASAVNAAFRQVGAVLGTALLVAIVGDPTSLPEALTVADRAYLFAALAGLASGAAALTLRSRPHPTPLIDAERELTAEG